jgi:hypothetical protein
MSGRIIQVHGTIHIRGIDATITDDQIDPVQVIGACNDLLKGHKILGGMLMVTDSNLVTAQLDPPARRPAAKGDESSS